MFNPGDGIIQVGDPTSHGGKVITGQQNYTVDGKAVACVGDKVTCPKDGHNGVTTIVEGHPTIRVNGKQVAFHGCRTACGARLLSMSMGYHMLHDEKAEARANQPLSAGEQALAAESKAKRDQEQKSQIAPGFHVVREAGYRNEIKDQLLPSPSPDVDAMFARLNTHLSDYVLPGSIVVLSDPENQMCMVEEQQLQDQARLAQQTVQRLEPAQAETMMVNWEAVLELSDDLGDRATEVSLTASAMGPLKNASAEALDGLAGALDRGERYVRAQGERLLSAIEAPARQFMDRAFELSESAQALKAKIGVASDKALHSVAQAFEGFPKFHIPTVAEGIQRAGSVASTLDVTTYIGIGLDVTSTELRVQQACHSVAASKSCRQVQLEEYGGLVTGTLLSAGGAGGAGTASRTACLAIGLHPAGRLVCSIVMTGAGAYGGGEAGRAIGHKGGQVIYEVIYGDDGAGESQ
ncbi:PAAR domain-containing protein [Salinicola corii]|uniref:PAAR domain-containing protein n=1 Tax=Salinicola corii TaxID=2606937 RepID=A0A640WBC7_9GAMM|nr:PAAR domain-containing protein [Salinicola corii]KAA0016692.1 PAAR domain-containing protein [Salinicola corii]